ncbi:adenine nucleotide alpha hydrolases-like superfamily protein [Actinidia rufa]|uniref:Adenine nucleotide alpha hydrolases-like superfamily protein n=1 Tax=Actinidia rufa TaxID=165716 RepID=A0A7J0EGM7_9ERIC|nr:adenine nucleotide alpha hydrolases-like superfamily protein [Actinidia rufa]
MTSSGSFLRQLSGREAWKSTSKRWGTNERSSWKQMEGLNINMYGGGETDGSGGGVVGRKRVMVVVDESSHSKHAMMWALTHVANKGDLLTLLHIIPPLPPSNRGSEQSSSTSPYLASSLGSLCKACKPEVEVEALVIQGPKLATVVGQVKKLEVSVLVLGQKKPSALFNCLCGSSSTEEFVEQCINGVECLTIGVRKQSKGIGGYLISTRWQKNFWLLA